MPIELSTLSHVSCVVDNADESVRFLGAVFEAPEIERAYSSFAGEESEHVRSTGLGDVTLQFIQPKTAEGYFHRALAENGPYVHSLAFFVADLDAALAQFSLENIDTISRSSISVTREGRLSQTRVYVLDTMERLGFYLELIEGSVDQTRIGGSARDLGNGLYGNLSPLLHIELAIDNHADICDLLGKLFGSQRIEIRFAEYLSSLGPLDIVHVNLGNVVLQYCRPMTSDSSWGQLLARRGRAIHNITWLVRNMNATVAALERNGAQDLKSFMLDFGRLVGQENVPPDLADQRIVNLVQKLGFHIELTEKFADNIDDFIFNPLSDWQLESQKIVDLPTGSRGVLI